MRNGAPGRACRHPLVIASLAGSLGLGGLLVGCERRTPPTERPPASAPASAPASRPAAAASPAPAALPAKALLTLDQLGPLPAVAAASQPALPERAAGPLAQARTLCDAGRNLEALTQVQAARRFAPRHVEVETLATRILLALGNESEAALTAQKAAELGARDLAVLYLVGRSLQNTGRTEQAITQYRLALQSPDAEAENPKLAMTCLQLGLALQDAGYLTAAAEQYERFLELLGRKLPSYEQDSELSGIQSSDAAAIPCRLGAVYLRLGQPTKAGAAYYKAMMANAKSAEARQGYVRAMVAAGRTDDALASMAVLLTDFPTHPQTPATLGEALPRLGAVSTVVPQLLKMIGESRNPQATLDLLAASVTQAGHPELVEAMVESMLQANPTHMPTRWRVVRSRVAASQPAPAFEAVVQAVQADPLASLALLADLQADTTTTTALLPSGLAAAKAQPKVVAVQVAAALVALAAGQFDTAAACARQADTLQPNAPAAMLLLAQVQLADGQWRDVLAVADRAFAAGQASRIGPARLHVLRGQALLGLDDYAQAIQAFTDAVTFDRRNVDALRGRADAYRQSGAPGLAQRDLRAALELSPGDPLLVEQLFDLLLTTRSPDGGRDLQGARDLVEQLPARARTSMPARRMEACLAWLERLGSAATAPSASTLYIRTLQDLVAVSPGDARNARLLASLYFEQFEFDTAARVVDQALKRHPRDAELLTLRADLLAALGRIPEATAAFQALVERFPNRQGLRMSLADLLIQGEQFDAGRKIYEDLLADVDLGALDRSGDDETKAATARRAVGWMQKVLGSYAIQEDWAGLERTLDGWLAKLGAPAAPAAAKADNDEEDAAEPAAGGTALVLQVYAGRLALRGGAFDRAVALYDAALKGRPQNDYLAERLLAALIRAGQFDRARRLAADRSAQRQDITFLCYEALALYYLGDQQKAQDLLSDPAAKQLFTKDALADNDNVAKVLEQLRLAYFRVDLLEAARRYDDALGVVAGLLDVPWNSSETRQLSRQQFFLQTQYLLLLGAARRFDDAAARLAEWEGRSPERRSDWLNLRSTVLAERGDHAGADAALQKIIDTLKSNNPAWRWTDELAAQFEDLARAYNNLGYAWADRTERLDEAEKYIRRAVALDRQVAIYQRAGDEPGLSLGSDAYADSLGWVLYKQQKFGPALWWLNRSLDLGGWDVTILDHLGDASWRLGYRQHARWAWRCAAAMYVNPVPNSLADRPGNLDPRIQAAVQAKLEALAADRPPPLAPTAAEQPASRPASAPATQPGRETP